MSACQPNKNKTVLVLGGTSMVGKAIDHILQTEMADPSENWIFVGSKDGDLTKYDETKGIFATHRPTHVVNLAAKVGGLFKNLECNVEFLRGNMYINDNVLRCSHETKVEKVVSCMSTCVFPNEPPSFPLDETMIHMGEPHRSNWGYAFGKRIIDAITQCYNFQYGYKWTSVIPCNVYGPHDNFSLNDSHVIPGLIHKCYLAKKEGTPLVVSGSGRPVRQFLYCYDLARLFIWALRDYNDPETIIFSTSKDDEVHISEAATAVAKALKFEGEIVYDKTKSDGIYRKTASNLKLMALRPETKFTQFEQAVQETVDWFVEHFDTDVRK